MFFCFCSVFFGKIVAAQIRSRLTSQLVIILSRIVFVLSLLFISVSISADDSYRYSLAGSYTDVDFGGKAEGELWGVSGAFYFEPVSLDGAIPYASTAFYTRTSAISVESRSFEYWDLNIVSPLGVLKQRKGDFFTYNVHLAKKELPLWVKLTATKVGSEGMLFSSSRVYKSFSRHIYDVKLGWFITEHTSLNGLYSQDKDLKSQTFGLALEGLFILGEYGFISARLDFQEDHSETIEQEVVRGSIRNLDTKPINKEERGLALSYFPNVATEVGLSRRELTDDQNIRDTNSMSFYGSYFLTARLKLKLSYLKYEISSYPWDLIYDNEQLTADISYRF